MLDGLDLGRRVMCILSSPKKDYEYINNIDSHWHLRVCSIIKKACRFVSPENTSFGEADSLKMIMEYRDLSKEKFIAKHATLNDRDKYNIFRVDRNKGEVFTKHCKDKETVIHFFEHYKITDYTIID